jgi:DNA polymerase-3 subunit alpha
VLQSTISIAALVKPQPAKCLRLLWRIMPIWWCFHFVRDIFYHNKAAEAKIKRQNGEEPTEVPMKPIVLWIFVCEDHKNKSVKDNGYQIVLLAKTKKAIIITKMSSDRVYGRILLCTQNWSKSNSGIQRRYYCFVWKLVWWNSK